MSRDPSEKDSLTIMAICSMIDLAKVQSRLDDIARKIDNDDAITEAEKQILRDVWKRKKRRIEFISRKANGAG